LLKRELQQPQRLPSGPLQLLSVLPRLLKKPLLHRPRSKRRGLPPCPKPPTLRNSHQQQRLELHLCHRLCPALSRDCWGRRSGWMKSMDQSPVLRCGCPTDRQRPAEGFSTHSIFVRPGCRMLHLPRSRPPFHFPGRLQGRLQGRLRQDRRCQAVAAAASVVRAVRPDLHVWNHQKARAAALRRHRQDRDPESGRIFPQNRSCSASTASCPK